MNGVELAARYAFAPNCHGYCGTPSFSRVLKSGNTGAMENELKKFRAHYAYLTLIARANALEPFDKKVVEAFWIGNRLLESVSTQSLRRFIARDLFAGRKTARTEKLCKNLPEGALPHHSFNSLYINFVTDSVSRSVENYDSCCITAGKVISSSEKSATLRRFSLARSAGSNFSLGAKNEVVDLERRGARFVASPKPGDILSVHWGMAVQKLTDKDYLSLRKYTQANIRACNDAQSNNR